MSITMRFPEGKAKVFTMTYDDGFYQDIRLVEIMNKNGIKGTFNINSGSISETDATEPDVKLSIKQIKELYMPNGHEVALHTLRHSMLADLPIEQITYEYLKDKEILEDIFGTIIRGSAYPYSRYNDAVLKALRACGVAYARGGDQNEKFELPDEWLEFMPTARHNNPDLFSIADSFLELQLKPMYTCKMFSLMGHSFEFDRDNNWDMIEKFLDKMGGREDIWYATNIEIYDYVRAFKSVRFNLAQTIAENPTATDVWLIKNGKLYKIPAGERVELLA